MTARRFTKPTRLSVDWSKPITRGLVGAWPFFEGAGNLTRDLARGRNAEFRGDAVWNTVIDGRSIGFDGNGDYLNIVNSNLYAFGAGDFSISARVYPTTTSGMRTIVGKDVSGGRQFILLMNVFSGGDLQISYFVGSDEPRLTVAGVLSANTLADVVAQRRGNSFEIYVDGKLRGSGTSSGSHGTMNSTSTALRLGARQYGGYENWWQGSLGYVLIHRRALTAAEVLRLHTHPYELWKTPGPRLEAVIAGIPGVDTTVRLTWTDNSEGEDGFSIERDDDGGGFVEIDTVAAGVETYDDSPEIGHTYTYRVRATSAALGDSEYSNEVEVTV